ELFSGPDSSFSGRFFSFDGVTIEPQPVQPGGPPLWVGGKSDAARRRAGELGDGWMPIWVSPEGLAEGLADVRRHSETSAAAVMCPALVGPGSRERLASHLAERYSMKVEPRLIDRYASPARRRSARPGFVTTQTPAPSTWSSTSAARPGTSSSTRRSDWSHSPWRWPDGTCPRDRSLPARRRRHRPAGIAAREGRARPRHRVRVPRRQGRPGAARLRPRLGPGR